MAAIVGARPRSIVPIDRGHLANRRYRVDLSDGRTVFVKEPTSAFTAAILADERRAYEAIGPRRFLPAFVGATDDLLVVEHLTDVYWPPPWRPGDLGFAVELLEEIASVEGPAALRDLEDDDRHRVWARVAAAPEGVLDLEVCDRAWLEASFDALVASDECRLGGAALVHGDFRSDNLAIVDGRAMAVDWGSGARGRADYDVVSFAIATAGENGSDPEEIATAADPSLVAVFAGTYAFAAALTSIPAPIRVQLRGFLEVALPWAARLLGLPPPRR